MTEKRNNDRNVPSLRFPGFNENWKSAMVGELMDFKVTNSLSREKLNYTKGTVKNIHYGDIHTKFQTLFDIKTEEVPYINNDVPLNKIHEECFCKDGDLVFADASEDLNDIGKSIEILNTENQKLLAGLHTLLGRPKPNTFYPGFAGYLFISQKVRTQIQREAQGAKVLGISVGRISKVELNYPSLEEQKKISKLLSNIDTRIQTQNKIIEQLESLIKALKADLLNGAYRFKNEREELFPKWEQKQVMEIAFKKASNISANTLEDEEGEFKIYGATGVLKQISYFKEEQPYISIVKDGAGVGRLFLCEEKTSVLGTLEILKNYPGVDLQFLYYLLSEIDFSKYVTGSTIPHIYFKNYSTEKVNVPCLSEQKRISAFLSSIDDKIELERNLLIEYLSKKKYLLNSLLT